MQQMIEDVLLTFNEAKSFLRVSRSTLLRMMDAKEVPAYKVGNNWRFYKSELKQVIKPVVVVKATEQGESS